MDWNRKHEEKRRVNYHPNGKKLPFLFHYQEYIDFAHLLRSNVKTVCRQEKKKKPVCRQGTDQGGTDQQGTWSDFSRVTLDYTHGESNQQQGWLCSTTRWWFSLSVVRAHERGQGL